MSKGSKVVIVEDNEDSGQMLAAYLESAGFLCELASDGYGGLALIREKRPDIAIIDVGLPGLDGLAVARSLRGDATLTGLHLVALTGYGRAEDREAAQAAGFDDHFVKPVSLELLVRRLHASTAAHATRAKAQG